MGRRPRAPRMIHAEWALWLVSAVTMSRGGGWQAVVTSDLGEYVITGITDGFDPLVDEDIIGWNCTS